MSHEQVNWSKSYKQNSSMNMLPHKCKLSLSQGGNGDLVKLVVSFICNNGSQRVWGDDLPPRRHVSTSGDIFGCVGGVLLASSA